MQKIEMLYSTIKKLSQIEKRNFRLEITKYKETSDYLKVYDFLGKSETFPSQAQRMAFVEKEKIKYLHMHVGYIFDKLIHFLLENRTPLYETAIQAQLSKEKAYANMLRGLGFLKAAEKASLNLLKKADEHGYYQFSISALLDLHIYQNYTIKPTVLNLPPINGQDLPTIERMQFYQSQLQQHELLKLLNIQCKKAITLIRRDPTTDIAQLNLASIPNVVGTIINKKTQILFHQVKIFSFTIHNQYEELCAYVVQLKQEMDHIYFEDQDEVIFAAFLLHTYGDYVLFDKLDPSFITFAKNFKKTILEKGKYLDNISPNILNGLDILSKTLLLETLYFKEHLQPRDIQLHIQKLKFVNEGGFIGSKLTQLNILFKLSFLCLIAKDYETVDHYLTKIKNTAIEEAKVFLWEIPFINLIKSFENDSVKRTRYLINKLKAKQKNKKNPPIQQLLLDLIQELLNSPKTQYLSIMRTTLPLLIQLENDFMLWNFRYSFWLKNRIKYT